jgi:hypothetical protein
MTQEYGVYHKGYIEALESHSKSRCRGWVMASILSLVAIACVIGQIYATVQLKALQAEVSDQSDMTAAEGRAIIRAWEEQHFRDDEVKAWKEYVAAREELTKFNRKSPKSFKEAFRKYNP